MGPNGSGKSTLSSVIAGREDYEVEGGSISFEGDDILELDPEEGRTKESSYLFNILLKFLEFQYLISSKHL